MGWGGLRRSWNWRVAIGWYEQSNVVISLLVSCTGFDGKPEAGQWGGRWWAQAALSSVYCRVVEKK